MFDTTTKEGRQALMQFYYNLVRSFGTAAAIGLLSLGSPNRFNLLLGWLVIGRFIWDVYNHMERSGKATRQLQQFLEEERQRQIDYLPNPLTDTMIETWNFLSEIDPHALGPMEDEYYDVVAAVGNALTKAGIPDTEEGTQ